MLAAGPIAAKSLPVLTDGSFDEWKRRAPRASDPADDRPEGGLDLRRLWVADDGEALFLRIEVGRETVLQNPSTGAGGNRLRLYLDLDAKRATGASVGVLGVDLEIRFGERQLVRYEADGTPVSLRPGAGLHQAQPTFSADEFEIRVELPPEIAGSTAAGQRRRKIKLALRDEIPGGDRLPDRGILVYRLGKKAPAPPRPIELERPAGRGLRILSLNVEDARIGVVPAVYERLFQTLDPDIICLQSLREWSAVRTLEFVEEVLPGRSWEVVQVDDIHTVSSFPILASAPVDANLVTHIGLPSALGGGDLVLFNAHPPCCDNDAGRDEEVDNLAATWRDLLAGTGPFAIDPDDPMILLGDLNLVGFRRQFLALRDGTFVDAANGPDFAPGRSEGSLREAPLRHTHRRLIHTWRRATESFAPGKLDFVLYTGDALELVKSFVPDTEGMPADALEAAGWQAGDSLELSDHLPLVVDFELRE